MMVTQGIILKSEDFREADRRLSFYTADFGKMIVLARGVRKIKSKLAGHLVPFSALNLNIARGKNYDHLTGVGVNKRLLLLEDLQKTLLAQRLLQRVDELTKEEKPDKKIFQLISVFLSELNMVNVGDTASNIVADAFVLKLLSFLGYQPHLFRCVKCGQKMTASLSLPGLSRAEAREPDEVISLFFSVKDGGIVCSNCRNKYGPSGESDQVLTAEAELPNLIKISKETLGLLQIFLIKKLGFFRTVFQLHQYGEVGPQGSRISKEAHQVVADFLNWHLH